MRRPHQLHPPLGNRACRLRLQLGADLVDHDHLGHVVLHRLDHHRMLLGRPAHLHAPRPPDARMRHVAIPSDLVGGVHHHHPLAQLIGQHARRLAQQRGLAHPRPPQNQQRAPLLDDVADEGHGAAHRAPDAAGQPHHLAAPVAHGADAVQRPPDPRPVVSPKLPDPLYDTVQLFTCDRIIAEDHLPCRESALGRAPKVQDNLE